MLETNLDHAEEELKAFNHARSLLVELYFRLNALSKKGRLINTEIILLNNCKINIEYYTKEAGDGGTSEVSISHSNDDAIKAHILTLEDILKIIPLVE